MEVRLKKNQKSVRMMDEVMAYVEKYPGDGFNQKFENLVLEVKNAEPERKKTLADLDKKIQLRRKQLDSIAAKIESLDITIQAIFSLEDDIHRIQKQIDKILTDG